MIALSREVALGMVGFNRYRKVIILAAAIW